LLFVVGAPRRLAVDRDQVMPARPQRLDPALEAAPERHRIDPVDQRAQPTLARDAEMEWCEPPQNLQVVLPPGGDLVKIIARGNRRTGQKQKNLRQRIHHPPRLALIVQPRKMLHKQGQPRTRQRLVHQQIDRVFHRRAPSRFGAPYESHAACQCKSPRQTLVNLTSSPWP